MKNLINYLKNKMTFQKMLKNKKDNFNGFINKLLERNSKYKYLFLYKAKNLKNTK